MIRDCIARQDAGGELPFQVWSEFDQRYLNPCPDHVDTPAVDCEICEPVDYAEPDQ
jgi:hypothetical protein